MGNKKAVNILWSYIHLVNKNPHDAYAASYLLDKNCLLSVIIWELIRWCYGSVVFEDKGIV